MSTVQHAPATSIDVSETRAVGDLRSRTKDVIEDVCNHPGRVQRFGRHRQAEVVVMSDGTLRGLLERVEALEHALLVQQTRSIMATDYDPVDPIDVEGEHYVRAKQALGID